MKKLGIICILAFIGFIAFNVITDDQKPVQDIDKIITLDGDEYVITEGVHFSETWTQDAWTMLCLKRKD